VRSQTNTAKLAQYLWNRDDFVFAAPVYYLKESGARIDLLDGNTVKMKDGADAEDVDKIVRKYGLYPWEPSLSSDSRRIGFGFPASANVTALELVADIHRRPMVEWADVVAVSEIQFGAEVSHATPTVRSF